MAKNSLSFANFAAGYPDAVMTPELVQRMFGNQVCKNQSSPCELTLAAKAFIGKANKAMQGGRCEGFAVMSALMASGKVSPTDFGGMDARDLTLSDNAALQGELAYWFTTQLHPSVAEKTKGYMAKDVMPKLAQGLAKGAKDLNRIGIVKKEGDKISGGHSLTPIAYYPEGTEGVYLLRVYDNNLPDTERTMRIDTKKNRWEYEASANPAKKSSLYYGDDTNNNPLYLAPIFTRTGVQSCYFCDGTKSQVTSSGGAQIGVTSDGKTNGVVNGEFKVEGGSVTPSFSAENDSDGASFIVNTAGSDVTVSLQPGDDGTSTDTNRAGVDVQGDSFLSSVSGLTLDDTDQLSVKSSGKYVSYENNSGSPLTLGTQVLVNKKTVSVSATLLGSSDQVGASVDDNGVVIVEAKGAPGVQVVVAIAVETSDGGTKSGTLAYTSDGDSAVGANSNDLEMMGTLTGTVNNNGVMQPVTNACADLKISGMESDVDCGGTCNTRCSEGQICNAGTDCLSTVCNGVTKKCVATRCLDGAKSGDESDIDCGGTMCGKCGVGKTCARSLDCSGGLTCQGNQCRVSYLLRVNVTGLPILGTIEFTNGTNMEKLTVSANGTNTFATRPTGAYSVTITQQPLNAVCTIPAGGSGTAVADTTLQVTCTPIFVIAGTVSGLDPGNSVTLINNAGDATTVGTNGLFGFNTRVAGGYAVTVQTQPIAQNCLVTNASGTAIADVSDVTVTCTSGFTIGGTLSGLPMTTSVTLQNNGVDSLPLNMNGLFSFMAPATAYNVTVSAQPAGATCTVVNGVGTALAIVNNVAVTCVPSGTLDTTFAGTGYISIAPNGFQNEWFRVAINPDNSQVWVGRDQIAGNDEDWIISKLTAAGALDTTFGTSGHLHLSRGTFLGERAQAIFRNTNGTFLVAGTVYDSGNLSFALARITAAGALDTTFGTSGWAIFDFSLGAEYLQNMKVLADGSMILIGNSGTGTSADVQVIKVTAAGALDTTFGTNGRYLLSTAGVEEMAYGIDVNAATGDIFVVGYSGSPADTLLISLSSSGALNTTFGTNGVKVIDLSGTSQFDLAKSVVFSGSALTIAGWAQPTTNNDYLLAQFSASTGALNAAFGTAGKILIDRAGASDILHSLMPVSGGFLAGGLSGYNLSVLKFTSSGVLDPNFGTAGQFQNKLSSAVGAYGYDITFDNAGKIVVGGMVSGSASANNDLGAARLNP